MKRTTYLNILALVALCAGVPAQAWQWSQLDPRPYMFPAHYAAIAQAKAAAEAKRQREEQSMRNIKRGTAVIAGLAAATCGTALVGAGVAAGTISLALSPANHLFVTEKMADFSARISPLKAKLSESATLAMASVKDSAASLKNAANALNEKSKLFAQRFGPAAEQPVLLLPAGSATPVQKFNAYEAARTRFAAYAASVAQAKEVSPVIALA